MTNQTKPRLEPRSFYSCVILAALLFAFILAFSLLAPILLSLLLTLLFTLAINPVIMGARAWAGGRKRATGIIAAAFIILIALTSVAFLGPIKTSVANLSEQLPGYWARLQKPLIRIEKQAVVSEQTLQAEVTKEMAQSATNTAAERRPGPAPVTVQPKTVKEPTSLRSSLSAMLQGVAGSFTAVAINVAQIVFVLVTVFFGVIFTLMDPNPIFGTVFGLVPERHHAKTLTIMQRIGKFVPGWALSTLMGMLTIGLLVFLLMWPIFGFIDALVLGLMAGLFEAIPYLGPILSAVPAVLLAVGKGGMTPVWVIVAYLAVQALENNVILPIIMARGMKLHPVQVIFSMLLCVAAFGVLGVLVAAPLVGIVAILHDELYRKRLLPSVTDADLTTLARRSLNDNKPAPK